MITPENYSKCGNSCPKNHLPHNRPFNSKDSD